MALNDPRVIGRDVTVSDGQSITAWQTINFTETGNTADATAADSVEQEDVFTTMRFEGTVTGYMGAASVGSGGWCPLVGDVVLLACTVGADNIRDFSNYTNVKVTKVTGSLQQNPGTVSFDFSNGKLNDPPSLS